MVGKIKKSIKRWILVMSYSRAMSEFARMGRYDIVENIRKTMVEELDTLK